MREKVLNLSKHYEEGGFVYNLAMKEIEKNNIKPIERVNVEKWNGVSFEHCFNIDSLEIPGYVDIIFSNGCSVAKEDLCEGISYFVKREYYLLEGMFFSVIKEIHL